MGLSVLRVRVCEDREKGEAQHPILDNTSHADCSFVRGIDLLELE